MRILLHIGTDKAGSTAIQQHLYQNRHWLLDRQVYVPLEGLGENNGHAQLFESESDEALERLAAINDMRAKIVELRFFAGMTVAEVAEALGVSKRTVEGHWTWS